MIDWQPIDGFDLQDNNVYLLLLDNTGYLDFIDLREACYCAVDPGFIDSKDNIIEMHEVLYITSINTPDAYHRPRLRQVK